MNTARFDLITKHFNHQYMFNALQVNNGNGSFSEIAQLAGVANTDWSWSSLFIDADNDGHKDLFVTNGIKRDIRFVDGMNNIRDLLATSKIKPHFHSTLYQFFFIESGQGKFIFNEKTRQFSNKTLIIMPENNLHGFEFNENIVGFTLPVSSHIVNKIMGSDKELAYEINRDELLQLLSKRILCAQKIGAYKKEHNIPILQVSQWQEILNAAIQKRLNLGLSDTFVTQFLNGYSR